MRRREGLLLLLLAVVGIIRRRRRRCISCCCNCNWNVGGTLTSWSQQRRDEDGHRPVFEFVLHFVEIGPYFRQGAKALGRDVRGVVIKVVISSGPSCATEGANDIPLLWELDPDIVRPWLALKWRLSAYIAYV